MRRTAALAAMSIVLVALVLWMVWPLRQGLTAGSSVNRPTGGGHGLDVPAVQVGSQAQRVDVAPPGQVAIYVRSEDGGPVVKALVTLEPTSAVPARHWRPEACRLLGATDAEGRLVTPADAIRGSALRVTAPLFEVGGVPRVEQEPPTQLVVVLRKAVRLAVRCRDKAGVPLAGVQVAVSRSPLSKRDGPTPRADSMQASGVREIAIHTTATAETGEATFECLPRGMVFVRCDHPSYVLISGLPQNADAFLLEEDLQLDLVFDVVLGALGLVVDDVVLGWSVKLPDGLVLLPSNADALSWVLPQWQAKVGQEVMCCFGTAAKPGVPLEGDGKVAQFDMFTAQRGSCRVEVPIRPLGKWMAPLEIRLGQAGKVKTSPVRVFLRTPSGREIENLSGISLRPATGSAAMFLSVVMGASPPRELPCGRYVVSTSQPWFEDALNGTEIQVGDDPEMAIALPFEVAPCRLRWEYESGLPVDQGHVSFQVNGRTRERYWADGLADCVWFLPVGASRVSIETPRGALRDAVVEVSDVADPQVIHVGTVHD